MGKLPSCIPVVELVATPFLVLEWDKQIRSCSPFMKYAIIDGQ